MSVADSEPRGVEGLLERFIEHYERRGERLSLEELCRDPPHLRAALAEELRRYGEVEEAPTIRSCSS